MTVLFNADTVQIVNTLWQNPQLRAAVAAQAEAYVTEAAADAAADPSKVQETFEQLKVEVAKLNLPLGWTKAKAGDPVPGFREAIRAHWLGWLLTAMAVSLGAPFWFQMLQKLSGLRDALSPEEKPNGKGGDSKPKPAQIQVQVVGADPAPPPQPENDR